MNHEQKTQYMKNIGVGKMLESQSANFEALTAAEEAVDTTQAILKGSKIFLDLEDARLVVGAKGKNAEERKASLIQSRKTDEVYVSQAQAVDLAESELSNAKRTLNDALRQHTAINLQIRLAIAQLHFMAGAD